MSSQRSSRMIKEQKHILLDFFVCRHPELANYGELSPEQIKTLDDLWVECSEMLNATGPPKDISHWKGCWSDLKNKVKRKAIDLKYRPTNVKPLTDLEEKLLTLINKTSFLQEPTEDESNIEDDKSFQEPATSPQQPPPAKRFPRKSLRPPRSLPRSSLRLQRTVPRSSPRLHQSAIPKKRVKVKSEINDFLHDIGDNINTNHNIADALNNVARALNNLADAINNFR